MGERAGYQFWGECSICGDRRIPQIGLGTTKKNTFSVLSWVHTELQTLPARWGAPVKAEGSAVREFWRDGCGTQCPFWLLLL